MVCARSTIQTRSVDEHMHRPRHTLMYRVWLCACGRHKSMSSELFRRTCSPIAYIHAYEWPVECARTTLHEREANLLCVVRVECGGIFTTHKNRIKPKMKRLLSMCECRRRLPTIDATAFVVCVQLIHGVRRLFVRHSHT